MLFENLWRKVWKKTKEQDTTTKQCVYCAYIYILWEKTKIMLVVGKDSTWIWKMFFPEFYVFAVADASTSERGIANFACKFFYLVFNIRLFRPSQVIRVLN
jgi:hypothetical protein